MPDRPPRTTDEPARPGPGEALVRVHASSLNYHDYLVATGRHATARAGVIPLSDGAGEVIALGPPAASSIVDPAIACAVGDRVLGTFFPRWQDGPPAPWKTAVVAGEHVDGYARAFAVVPMSALTPAPRSLSFAEAATLPCAGLTAWRALMCCGGIRAGDSVLVQGTGGVSVFALQLAKAMGATVIATTSSQDKMERLYALGADHVINARDEARWGRAAKAWTGGDGVDHVLDMGGASGLNQSVEACRLGGAIALVGLLAGTSGQVATAQIMTRQLRLQGVVVGSRADQVAMVRAVEALGIRPVIDRQFPLQELGAAFRYQESGRHVGKIAVAIGPCASAPARDG